MGRWSRSIRNRSPAEAASRMEPSDRRRSRGVTVFMLGMILDHHGRGTLRLSAASPIRRRCGNLD